VSYDYSGNVGCVKNMGSEGVAMTSVQVDSQTTGNVVFPGSELDSDEQADTHYNHEVPGMPVKCSHKDIVFLGDGQDSDKQAIFNGKLF
jgi:hypothetical protein